MRATLATEKAVMLYFKFHRDEVPDESLVTGIVVVPFVGHKCVMTDVRHRPGYEFTAGHTDLGETPEQTARRELKEETGATAQDMYRVGYVLCHNADRPIAAYPFPDSYLVVFAAACGPEGVGEALKHESRGVLVCSPGEAEQHLKFNEALYLDMLTAAREHLGV